MAQHNDEYDRDHERSLRAVDPRGAMRAQQPRMVLLADEPLTVAERGTELNAFIEPEGK